MIDLYFPHLALILEESHEFVYFVVMLGDVLHVYAVFSLPFLPSWLLSVSIIVLRRRTSVWFRHLIDERRLRDWIIHRFSFGRRRRRWWNESLPSEEQRSSKDRF